MNESALRRLMAPFRRRLKAMVTRGVVKLVDPAMLMQTLQAELLADELLDGVEHFEPYGFTARPHPGAEGLFLSFAGDRAHTVCIAVADRQYRLQNLAAGEVALYTDEGDLIHFQRGRNIAVTAGTKVTVTAPQVEIAASASVTLTSPQVEISGALTVQGAVLSNTSIADPSGTMSEMRSTYNSHTHPGGGVPSPQMS